jgi:hypothetical protein
MTCGKGRNKDEEGREEKGGYNEEDKILLFTLSSFLQC